MTVNRNGIDQGAVSKRTVTAKGNLIVGTANSVVSNLAVGNDGETIVADSSTSTGLRYQAPVNCNPILNSSFQVWQRGTTGSNPNTVALSYQADRWNYYRPSGFATGITISRQTTSDTTNLPFIQYCARIQRAASNTSTLQLFLGQNIESVNSIPYAGKTVTLSFYARAGANFSAASSILNGSLITGTGTDQNIINGLTSETIAFNTNATLTTTWQRFTVTGSVGSSVTQLVPFFQYTPVGTAGANDYYEVTGVQIEIGSVATPFKTYAGTIQGELAACQRYYYRITSASGYMGINAFAASSTTALIAIPFVTSMRTITAVDYANMNVYDGTSQFAVTLTLQTSTNSSQMLFGATTGMTAFRPYTVIPTGTGFIGLSGEL